MRLGIVGCGTIGSEVALAIDSKKVDMELVAIYDILVEKSTSLNEKLLNKPHIANNLNEVFELAELVFESAKVDVVKELLRKALEYRKMLFIMSVGGLLKNYELYEEVMSKGIKVFFPSGAIAGLDCIRAASLGNIRSLKFITKKPPEAFKDNEFLKSKGINPEDYLDETVIYKGSVYEAIENFPANINVLAAVVLSGIKPENIRVKILTGRKIKKNIHMLNFEGEFGSLKLTVKNVPSEKNPKTSKLAIFSAISELKRISQIF